MVTHRKANATVAASLATNKADGELLHKTPLGSYLRQHESQYSSQYVTPSLAITQG